MIEPDGTIRIFVPKPTPSANTFSYSHWRVRHADKQEWLQLLTVALYPLRNESSIIANGKRRLRVQRYGKRPLDIDNGYGGLKGIIDNMRKLRLLVDDDAKSLDLRFENMILEKGVSAHSIFFIETI